VPIDQSRQYQPAAMIERISGRRWRALANRRDDLTAHRDIAIAQHAIGADKIADDHAVKCI
jgi:hypothetical protein